MALSYSKWKLCWETGDRKIYEQDYDARRSFIEHVVPLARIYPEDGRFIERISDVVFAICDEYTWCLPAHQRQRDKNDNSKIDLFAAETALSLSLIYTLLAERLDPLILDRIRVEIKRRIFDTFLSSDCCDWWEEATNNWIAVCTGAVGCTMMLLSPEFMTEKTTARLVRNMRRFLDGFEDDGICTEGCVYWAYGVSFYVQFADMLKTFTDGKIDLFAEKKMRAIATFPQKMFLSGKAGVSFADGGRPELCYSFGVVHRLKTEFPEDIMIYAPEYGTYTLARDRLCIRIFAAIWHRDEYYNAPSDINSAFEEYAQNTAWLTKRTESYGFAAKAGHNDEFHNHNDVGTFIFAKDGKQIFADLGPGEYTKKYFGSERYTVFEASAESHSLPIIGGKYQCNGREFTASDVEYQRGRFSMDIAGAYPDSTARSVKRCFDLDDDKVTLTDSFDVEEGTEIIERFISLT